MRAAVITFPGSNCDRDLAVGLELAGAEVTRFGIKTSRCQRALTLLASLAGFPTATICGVVRLRRTRQFARQ